MLLLWELSNGHTAIGYGEAIGGRSGRVQDKVADQSLGGKHTIVDVLGRTGMLQWTEFGPV
jgi:hypothetical protein